MCKEETILLLEQIRGSLDIIAARSFLVNVEVIFRIVKINIP